MADLAKDPVKRESDLRHLKQIGDKYVTGAGNLTAERYVTADRYVKAVEYLLKEGNLEKRVVVREVADIIKKIGEEFPLEGRAIYDYFKEKGLFEE